MAAPTKHSLEPAPSITSGPTSQNPHFVAIGGAPAVARLAERFYYHMATLPEAREIRSMHAADLEPMREVLERYLAEWMGGPAAYSAERGHPRLRRRHFRFPIGARERDAWMLCMRRALSEVVSDPGLCAELEAAFFKVADFLRNDAQHEHVHHAEAFVTLSPSEQKRDP